MGTTPKCRIISALAFIPRADVVTSFETLSDDLLDFLIPVLEYLLEDSYIGRPDRRGVWQASVFPIHL